MNIKVFKYNNLDTLKVKKLLGDDLEYIADFCVRDCPIPSSVYFSKNPDRSKNHKDYVMITLNHEGGYISGMDADEMENYRYQSAIRCLGCNDVIYSLYRHDCRSCSCNEENGVFIDGGKDYIRSGGALFNIDSGTIDFLTMTFRSNIEEFK